MPNIVQFAGDLYMARCQNLYRVPFLEVSNFISLLYFYTREYNFWFLCTIFQCTVHTNCKYQWVGSNVAWNKCWAVSYQRTTISKGCHQQQESRGKIWGAVFRISWVICIYAYIDSEMFGMCEGEIWLGRWFKACSWLRLVVWSCHHGNTCSIKIELYFIKD